MFVKTWISVSPQNYNFKGSPVHLILSLLCQIMRNFHFPSYYTAVGLFKFEIKIYLTHLWPYILLNKKFQCKKISEKYMYGAFVIKWNIKYVITISLNPNILIQTDYLEQPEQHCPCYLENSNLQQKVQPQFIQQRRTSICRRLNQNFHDILKFEQPHVWVRTVIPVCLAWEAAGSLLFIQKSEYSKSENLAWLISISCFT